MRLYLEKRLQVVSELLAGRERVEDEECSGRPSPPPPLKRQSSRPSNH